jgi:hypothetical protein
MNNIVKYILLDAGTILGGIILGAAWALWSNRVGNVQLAVFSPRLQLLQAVLGCMVLISAPHFLFFSEAGQWARDERWLCMIGPLVGWMLLVGMLCYRRTSFYSERIEAIAVCTSLFLHFIVYMFTFSYPVVVFALLPLWMLHGLAVMWICAAPLINSEWRFYTYVQDIRTQTLWVLFGAGIALATPPLFFFSSIGAVISLWVLMCAWHGTSTILPMWRLIRLKDSMFLPHRAVETDEAFNQEQNYGFALTLSKNTEQALDSFDRDFFLQLFTEQQIDPLSQPFQWYSQCYIPYIYSGQWKLPLAAITDPVSPPDKGVAEKVILGPFPSSSSSSSSSFSIEECPFSDDIITRFLRAPHSFPALASDSRLFLEGEYHHSLLADCVIYFRQFCPLYNKERYHHVDVSSDDIVPLSSFGEKKEGEEGDTELAKMLIEESRLAFYIRKFHFERIMIFYNALSLSHRVLPDVNQRTIACWHLKQRFLMDTDFNGKLNRHCIPKTQFNNDLIGSLDAICAFTPKDMHDNAERDRPINRFSKPDEFTTIIRANLETHTDISPGIQRLPRYLQEPQTQQEYYAFFHKEFIPRIQSMFVRRKRRWADSPPHLVTRTWRRMRLWIVNHW